MLPSGLVLHFRRVDVTRLVPVCSPVQGVTVTKVAVLLSRVLAAPEDNIRLPGRTPTFRTLNKRLLSHIGLRRLHLPPSFSIHSEARVDPRHQK